MHILEFRLEHAARPLTDAWQLIPIKPRHSALLGISFRPLQASGFNLDVHDTLRQLLAYPFQIIRLGAYWDRMEPVEGTFYPDELDLEIDLAEKAGKKIILCIGPLKTFGYPEFFVPGFLLHQPFPEHQLVKPSAYPLLLEAATRHIVRLVERYRQRECLLAWQLEHEAVDPLGMEHSWRLATAFVEREAETLRQADPTRPVLLNGFLPTSWPVRFTQWWNTRGQGDSLAVARQLADIIGIDYYPRHALFSLGSRTLYLDGSRGHWQWQRRRDWLAWAHAQGKPLVVAEGQAEPWEAVTTPPNPARLGMTSCLPEHLATNYNDWMGETRPGLGLYAYLFWGAEYWMLRRQGGDPSYLQAFARILEHS
jgi:hypothetical protein